MRHRRSTVGLPLGPNSPRRDTILILVIREFPFPTRDLATTARAMWEFSSLFS